MTIASSVRTLMSGILIAAVLLSGCATTPPQAHFAQAPTPGPLIDNDDTVTVTVVAKPGITLIDKERERLSQRIAARIAALSQPNATEQEPRPYRIEVFVTRYDRGNAFARLMLAGLGQIHIDGQVTLFALPGNKRLTDFHIEKTFAWGGVYGGSTTIETVEQGFAEGIAEALTQPHR